MNYILKKALEMTAALEKVSDFFLFESNRILHLLGCLIGTALFGWGFGVGAGLAAEIKDVQGSGHWDWLDIAADAIGTLIGEIVHFAIFKRW